jgi:hypothetical protein
VVDVVSVDHRAKFVGFHSVASRCRAKPDFIVGQFRDTGILIGKEPFRALHRRSVRRLNQKVSNRFCRNRGAVDVRVVIFETVTKRENQTIRASVHCHRLSLGYVARVDDSTRDMSPMQRGFRFSVVPVPRTSGPQCEGLD